MKPTPLILIALCAVLLPLQLNAQNRLSAGPKVGHVDFREINLWMQAAKEDKITVSLMRRVNGIAQPGKPAGVREVLVEQHEFTAKADNDFIVKAVFKKVEPGTTYTYQIKVNGKKSGSGRVVTPTLWKYRGDPPPLRIAMGSCHYTNDPPDDRPGTPYGDSSNIIFNSITAKDPDLMLWLGDNIYLREPDWNSRSGMQRRYRLMHGNPALEALFRDYPNYAIWDDHDYGPNDADRGFFNKRTSLELFCDNWANPTCNGNDFPGITTSFQRGDADFFLLDNRYHRAPNDLKDSTKTYLGAEQLQWLKDNLTGSSATFKIVAVGGQILSDARVFENMANYPEERREILDFIQTNNIRNVIFIDGDRHLSELSILKNEGLPRIIDFTVSPLTAGTARQDSKDVNSLSLRGSRVLGKRNFGMIEITGKYRERMLKFTIFDSAGNMLYTHEIAQE